MQLKPLSQMKKKQLCKIVSLEGNEETNRFFQNIGCDLGDEIMIRKKVGMNFIVDIKDGRFGIDKRFADKIIVEEL